MAQAHDDAVLRLCRNLETRRQRVSLDDQRVVSARVEIVAKPREDRLSIVTDFRRFAVHQLRRANDAPAKRLAHRLVAQADAEQRYLSGETIDDAERNAGVVRGSRPG